MWGELLERAEAMPPGPELAAVLAGIDGTLPEGQRLRLIALWARVRAWAEARELRETAELLRGEDPREAEADLGSALVMTRVSAGQRLDLAERLVDDLPATLSALEAGEISLRHAWALVDGTRNLADADRTEVETTILAAAGQRTAAAVRDSIRRLVARIDPQAQLKRRAEAMADRRVAVSDPDDAGMCWLSAYLARDEALRAFEAVRAKARQLPENPHGPLAREADALVELCTGGLAPRVELIVKANNTFDLPTLTGLLHGAHKVTVRPLGCPLPAEPRYRPSARLAEYIRALDEDCRFPHCRRPAHQCDLDHVEPWDTGGMTSVGNLMPLCRGHHLLKTFSGWHPTLHPDRTVTWIDPHGTEHVDPPPGRGG